MTTQTDKPRFPLGQLLTTPGACRAMEDAGQDPMELFHRHQCGHWGIVCREDWCANEAALIDGTRLLSSYRLVTGVTIWIITEASRSVSTILLPEEY